MGYINIDKLSAARLESDPFDYVVIPEFLGSETIRKINETYPKIVQGGSYPIESLSTGMLIKNVIDELNDEPFAKAIGEKFNVDLAGKPKLFSLRGWLRAKDGQIHTDSKDKIITVLLYLNDGWAPQGGRLRLLRDGKNLENFTVEVPPDNGTLLAFRRSDHSWHGHYPYEGQRRTLQMNWMVSENKAGLHAFRHKVSAAVKGLSSN